MTRQLQLFMAVTLIAFAPPLGAQNNTAPTPLAGSKTGKAQIVGVVVDSLNGRYLSGADVVIEGARATLLTDSLGKFKIDSLPPGTYQVGVFHPLLDTLGITLSTQPFHIGPDSSSFVLLAIPSAATIIRGLCPIRPGAKGTSAVIGHVNDPETLQPVAGAEVSIAWTEIEVSKEVIARADRRIGAQGRSAPHTADPTAIALGRAGALRRTSRLVRDSTDGSGAFKICGLPSSLRATLRARRGSAVTADIPISLGDKPAELFARTLLLSPADSGTKIGNATVSGLVVLEGSPTNAGSRIELVGSDIVAMTNEKGEFTMRNLPSGSQVLLARHLGFGAETVPVDLSSRQQKRVTIKLSKFAEVMDPVLVIARKMAALDKVGFSQRQKFGLGYYIDPERLQNMHPSHISDILSQAPGVRDKCVQYWVDDMPYWEAEPGDINYFVSGSEVVAVEVYQNIDTPGRYMRPGGCTMVILWTRFKIRS